MEKELQKPKLSPIVLWIMIVGSGLVVANNYYNQPLLSLMAKDFNVSESKISTIAMLTQIGYAFGLLFIIPLGDLLKRKRMILFDFVFIIIGLLGMYFAPSVTWLFPLSFLIGFSSVIPQIFVPMAAELAAPEKKVQAVGMVMSGLLVGILLSRVFSGFIGEYFGWREVYLIATILMFILWFAIYFFLPEVPPNYKGTYKGLMKSIIDLVKNEPKLRLASFRGATAFAAFSAFWTTLVFHLEEAPFFASSDIAGAFGLIGAVGALAAALVGKANGYLSTSKIIFYSIITMLISWGFFYQFGFTYWGLIIGVILIDLGLQAMHVSNQTIIFSLNAKASNRLNTVYMTSYFIGGSLGTFLAAIAWGKYQWNGVIGVGVFFTALCLLSHVLFDKKD
ncbi:MFS transporter [Algoriella sp.]|uniref:MFS transporter n=1 Tax=Algoriella sp. TaxID=1872434 RepID=UPI001B172676|nr:MFS transporter [Algoriella sp.]MBO6213456.1 MFS transporter [Algoriella sp.]